MSTFSFVVTVLVIYLRQTLAFLPVTPSKKITRLHVNLDEDGSAAKILTYPSSFDQMSNFCASVRLANSLSPTIFVSFTFSTLSFLILLAAGVTSSSPSSFYANPFPSFFFFFQTFLFWNPKKTNINPYLLTQYYIFNRLCRMRTNLESRVRRYEYCYHGLERTQILEYIMKKMRMWMLTPMLF